ncbi:hypothetical protein OPV22_000986 [Ensete ventricosum]|uniref:Uncharacterized protein n=1 Tax=Ensete ventricosum TaxID=4639 RepID=A0AAV8RP92_ENSVE|nr:hypothetical protein OPV22_000986 [Ensete ventricosum]
MIGIWNWFPPPLLGRSPLFFRFQALFSFAATIADLDAFKIGIWNWTALPAIPGATRRQIRAPDLQPCFLSPYQSEDIALSNPRTVMFKRPVNTFITNLLKKGESIKGVIHRSTI